MSQQAVGGMCRAVVYMWTWMWIIRYHHTDQEEDIILIVRIRPQVDTARVPIHIVSGVSLSLYIRAELVRVDSYLCISEGWARLAREKEAIPLEYVYSLHRIDIPDYVHCRFATKCLAKRSLHLAKKKKKNKKKKKKKKKENTLLVCILLMLRHTVYIYMHLFLQGLRAWNCVLHFWCTLVLCNIM